MSSLKWMKANPTFVSDSEVLKLVAVAEASKALVQEILDDPELRDHFAGTLGVMKAFAELEAE